MRFVLATLYAFILTHRVRNIGSAGPGLSSESIGLKIPRPKEPRTRFQYPGGLHAKEEVAA